MSSQELLKDKYEPLERIGNGAFGEIYKARDIKTNELVAIKYEKLRSGKSQLLSEYQLYKAITPHVGFPNVHWCGCEGNYQMMAMQLLGPNLSELLCFCGNRFSLKTILMLADQMIDRVCYLHSCGYLHRDIKPQNFLMGLGERGSEVHLIDLGLAKRYLNGSEHIPFTKGNTLVGTARYASINTHLGYECARRDDLEAVGYVLVYLSNGTLPWCGMKEQRNATPITQQACILEKKFTITPEELTKGMPSEFATYFHYCHGLTFEEKPDYNFLRSLFRDLFNRNHFVFDYVYDWTLIKMRQYEETLSNKGYFVCGASAE